MLYSDCLSQIFLETYVQLLLNDSDAWKEDREGRRRGARARTQHLRSTQRQSASSVFSVESTASRKAQILRGPVSP